MKPRGSLTTRLARLEDRAAERTPPGAPRDEAGWLAAFEHWGACGRFDREPDFPRALALFRDALARAQASTDPPFDPPPEFRPGDPYPHIRAQLWRAPDRFPELYAVWEWLGEMLGRLCDDLPPVSEAEFAELAAWFAEHDAALCALPSELLDVGNGRQTWCANLRYDLARGPRADGAGRAAEDIRQLKARYASLLT